MTLTGYTPAARTPAETGSPRISLVLNVYNEAAKLEGALSSCAGYDDLVIADMGSTDGTRDIASRFKARLITLPHAGFCEPGRQAAIDAAEADWVLVLDADERLPEGALARLRELASETPADISAYRLQRHNYISGTRIVSTGWGVDVERHPRFFRKEDVSWPAVIHSVPSFRGEVLDCPSRTRAHIEHLAFDSLEHAMAKFNRYSTVEAHERRVAGTAPSTSGALAEAVQEFLRRYSPETDGSASMALSMGIFMYRFLVDAKSQELEGWPTSGLPTSASMHRAWAAFRRELTDSEHEGHRASAEALFAVGDLEAARATLTEVAEHWGPRAGTLADLAAVEMGLGDAERAWKTITQALSLDPDDADARINGYAIALASGRVDPPAKVLVDWADRCEEDALQLDRQGRRGMLPAGLRDLPLLPGTVAELGMRLAAEETDFEEVDHALSLVAPAGTVQFLCSGRDRPKLILRLADAGFTSQVSPQGVVTGIRTPAEDVRDDTPLEQSVRMLMPDVGEYPADAPACPVCGGRDFTYLYQAQRQGDHVWRCACALVTYWPRWVGEDLLRHYDDAYVHRGDGHGYTGGYLAAEQDTAERMSTFALSNVLPAVLKDHDDVILDVGAATGLFVELATRAGLSCTGLEPSTAAVAAAVERGRDVRRGTAADARPGSADVVTLWDVIEHVDDPVSLLRDCSKALRPGGKVVVRTQDVSSDEARAAGPAWEQYITAHVVHFSSKTLRAALEQAGFAEVMEVERSGYMMTLVGTRPDDVSRSRSAPPDAVRVNLACGDDRRPGYVNVDAHTPADVKMDLLDLRFEAESVDEIVLSHALEHFSEGEFPRVLAGCREALSPSGRLLINVPDLEWVLRNWLALPEEARWDWALATVFGLQDNPGEFHRTGFSDVRLDRCLRSAGFDHVRVTKLFSHGQGCLWAEARKEAPPVPALSFLFSPATDLDVIRASEALRNSMGGEHELVVAERRGTAGPALSRLSGRVTWLRNTDAITEEEALAQAACVAAATTVVPITTDLGPSRPVLRSLLATVPPPAGSIPDSVRDWKLSPT